MPNVLVISPPFYSHAKPLAALAGAMAGRGARVTFACIPELKFLADDQAVDFHPFEGASNRNTGLGSTTEQPTEDRDRLLSFLKATRRGAVASLTSQANNRRGDMLQDPGRVLESVRALYETVRPDWCLVDQLSYPVTLALHCLGVPFASFVAGHPTDLPRDGRSFFGVPDQWPEEIYVDEEGLVGLKRLARQVDRAFTDSFNDVIRSVNPSSAPVESAFSFSSESARVFNYPEAGTAYPCQEGRDLFIGHCTAGSDELPSEWTRNLDRLTGRPRVLIAFGTFQWVHTDVIRAVHRGIRQAYPDAAFVVSAGDRAEELSDIADDGTLLRDFLPQLPLLPSMDVVVHHGGNNSFTESVVSSVPAIVLPFAADQFAVARDVSLLGLGQVLDPNRCTPDDVARAVTSVLGSGIRERVGAMAARVRARGPAWAAERILVQMDTGHATGGRRPVRHDPLKHGPVQHG
ncbi:nucleotide disphospho-sugar-binding domain-containing protein [Streptomyces sp. NPDC056909]|uniref:nucleotide disphospho-sugar-binding domain-containing protein n=1 Tax=Streptomyces sp. NPDC056909 TaxID=3345963 RepID=UPI0036B4D3B3